MSRTDLQWLDAEHALIGGVLLDDAAFWRVADRIDEADLAGPGHARIWQVVREMAQAGQPRDAVTIAERLRSEALARDVLSLANNAPGSANIAAYADLVLKAAEHRRVITAGQRIAKLGPDEAGHAAAILAAASKPKGAKTQHVGAVLADWYTDFERRYNGANEITGLPTGLRDLDEFTSGLQNGDLIVLAARPSMGKSALAGQLAFHAATLGNAAVVFSLEMPSAQLVNRMIAAHANVGVNALRAPAQIDPDTGAFHRITAAATALQQLPLHFDDTACLSIDQLLARTRQLHAQHALRLVVVDYLQIMQLRTPDKPVQAIGEITSALKRLAKELNLPVVLLSQLNRSVESRSDRRPIMADLRDSGSIEQDADIVAFIYRDEVYNPNSAHRGYAELIFRKHRNGSTGTVALKSELQFCRFATCDGLPAIPESDEAPRASFQHRFGRARPKKAVA